MLALHLDNLLFLLLIAGAGLLRLLASKAGNKTEEPPQNPAPRPAPTTPIERAPDQTDADRIRKFLEALGQPPTSTPPPPVKPRDVPPPLPEVYAPPRKRSILSPLPPLTTVPPPIEKRHRVTLPREIKKLPEPAVSPMKLQEAPKFEVQAEAVPPEIERVSQHATDAYGVVTQPAAAGERSSELAALLRSRGGLRQAIILREVFGPPRSLQPFAEPS
jgi:hypothetical protein